MSQNQEAGSSQVLSVKLKDPKVGQIYQLNVNKDVYHKLRVDKLFAKVLLENYKAAKDKQATFNLNCIEDKNKVALNVQIENNKTEVILIDKEEYFQASRDNTYAIILNRYQNLKTPHAASMQSSLQKKVKTIKKQNSLKLKKTVKKSKNFDGHNPKLYYY